MIRCVGYGTWVHKWWPVGFVPEPMVAVSGLEPELEPEPVGVALWPCLDFCSGCLELSGVGLILTWVWAGRLSLLAWTLVLWSLTWSLNLEVKAWSCGCQAYLDVGLDLQPELKELAWHRGLAGWAWCCQPSRVRHSFHSPFPVQRGKRIPVRWPWPQ